MSDLHLNVARERGDGRGVPAAELLATEPPKILSKADLASRGSKTRAMLRAKLGDDVFNAWLKSIEFESFDGATMRVSVPVQFLKKWIQDKYLDVLCTCCAEEFEGTDRVEIVLRQGTAPPPRANAATTSAGSAPRTSATAPARVPMEPVSRHVGASAAAGNERSPSSLSGSPLDPRCTFASFVVGPANRMAHAGAIQVAETVFIESRGFNPLFIHSAVGLGKSHLLQAIAWEVKRRTPHANVLYLTAERFRFEFVEAVRSQDGRSFKERLSSVDILLIDDLEFMQGEKTEQEFDHIINTLLDSGRQVVVASARPPALLERMNERLRSRLARGLVTELQPPDTELRFGIIERWVEEKRAADPTFDIPRTVVQLLAQRLTESGRELEGAVNRLFAQWQLLKTPMTLETVEALMRDLVHSGEPRRIKIDDILRVIARHYAVSKADILSERRHRSIVWPRQIGMYLAKQLTARSLPEIGRRFGDRDHTTVLHAIRKVDRELDGNNRLRDELDDLKKQLNLGR